MRAVAFQAFSSKLRRTQPPLKFHEDKEILNYKKTRKSMKALMNLIFLEAPITIQIQWIRVNSKSRN